MASGFGVVSKCLSLFLSALLIATPVASASADESGAATTAALAVSSDPPGASVYVDGRFVGATPTSVDRLSAGDHRVRIVKSGYLENGRIVTVGAGKTNTVSVKLTPAENAASQVVSSTGGGGGSRRWLWLGLAGGGAAAAAVMLMNRNKPPTAGTISVSPSGTGMATTTSYTFTSQGANDPNGDPLTYTWDFGDGSSGTGASTSHTFNGTGSFNVGLSVSDGKESVSAPATSVTVARNLAGSWSGGRMPFFDCPLTLSLTQSGTTLGGTLNFATPCFGSVSMGTSTASSPLTHPNNVTLQTQSFTFTFNNITYQGLNLRFVGPTNSAGSNMSGTITLSQPAFNITNSMQTTFSR